MNLIDRVRFLMLGEIPRTKSIKPGYRDPLAQLIVAALGLGKSAIWTPKQYDKLSEAGYQNCMTVYACVNQVARAAAGVEWKAFVGEKDAPKHPILTLLDRPNENDGKRAFIAKYFSYLLLAGNDYTIAGRIGTQPPLMLWLARPDRMTILPGTGGALVGGYVYTVAGKEQKFEFAQVMHSRLFHPTHDFFGLSPLEVAGRGVDVVNMSAEWNMRLLQNDMRPPGALSTDATLTQDTFNRLKDMMKNEWGGYENAGNPLLLEGGLKWINFAMNPKDLDWLNSTKLTKRDICTVFNVDPCLIGDAEYATYSNKQEARKGLYVETVLPLMYEFRDDLNRWLSPMFGPNVRLDVDRDKIEALQEDQAQKYAYLTAANFLKVNEKRVAAGKDEVPEGDVILVPVGMVPLAIAIEEPEPESEPIAALPDGGEEDEGSDGEEGKNAVAATPGPGMEPLRVRGASFWTVPERKERLWRTYEARVKAREKSFEQIAKSYIRAQADALRQRAIRLGSTSGLLAPDIFSVKEEAKRYARTFTPWYVDHFIRAGNAGMRASKGELFDDAEVKAPAWRGDPKKPTSWVFEMTPEQDAILKDMIFNSGTKVSETTLEIVEQMIRTANAENWTVGQFAQGLSDKVTDFGPWRARLWARTESVKVDCYGTVEGFKETEFVDLKGWMCSFVPDSRESHIAADGQEVALDDDFIIDGKPMAFPGDPKGGPENDCNCLCGTYPVIGAVPEGGE